MRMMRRKIDETDLTLLQILEENGRIPYLKLSAKLGITGTAVRKRVQKLLAEGVIRKFTADIEPKKIGYEAVAMLGIDVSPDAIVRVASELANIPNVKKVYTASGEHAIIAEVWAKDMTELQSLLDEKIGKIPGVSKVTPSLVLSRIK